MTKKIRTPKKNYQKINKISLETEQNKNKIIKTLINFHNETQLKNLINILLTSPPISNTL
jgi:hypothetical protein